MKKFNKGTTITVQRDGNLWAATDEDFVDLRQSEVGFGNTPYAAIRDLVAREYDKGAIVVGCEARDKITGMKGIVVAHTQWLTGCDRFSIQTKELKDGKPVDIQSFDETMLERIGEGLLVSEKGKVTDAVPPGGPRPGLQKTSSGEL